MILVALLTLVRCVVAQDFYPPPATNAVARVVVVQGENLLDAFLPDEMRVAEAFNRGLTNFTHTIDVPAAWHSLVKSNDVVGIKVFSAPGQLTGSRPAVVAAIVRGLLAAGLATNQVVIWDKHEYDLCGAGFDRLGETLGVPVVGAVEAGFDPNTYYLPDSPVIGTLVWGDLEFGQTNKDFAIGKKSFVSKLVSQRLTKIISVAPLLNESAAGVCGHFYSLGLGSVDNTRRFDNSPERLAVALPEIDALPIIGDRVVLHVTDALLGQYQGGPASFLQYATVLNQLWISRDPVALDTLAMEEIIRQRNRFSVPQMKMNFQIGTNAALLQLGINNPARIQVEKVP